jgi:hypothetical protein
LRGPEREPGFPLALLCLLWLGAALIGRTAAAGDAGVQLSWAAPEGCPSEEAVLAEVSRLLGPAEGPRHSVRASVKVTAERRGGFRARLSLETGAGRRERALEGPSCEAIGRATALILAFLVDPQAASERAGGPSAAGSASAALASASALPPPAASPSSAGAAPPAPAPALPATEAERRAEAAAWAPFAALGGAVDTSLGPGAVGGITAALGAASRAASVEVRAAYFLEVTSGVPARPAASAAFSSVSLGARACWRLVPWAAWLGACAGLDGARLAGRAHGISAPGEAVGHALLASAGLGAGVSPGKHLRLEAGLEVRAALPRPRFEIDGVGLVHRPPAAGLMLWLRVGWGLLGRARRSGRVAGSQPSRRPPRGSGRPAWPGRGAHRRGRAGSPCHAARRSRPATRPRRSR